ncbi:MAG: hypothetical protein AAGA48_25515 [Myxococcota bacterium]
MRFFFDPDSLFLRSTAAAVVQGAIVLNALALGYAMALRAIGVSMGLAVLLVASLLLSRTTVVLIIDAARQVGWIDGIRDTLLSQYATTSATREGPEETARPFASEAIRSPTEPDRREPAGPRLEVVRTPETETSELPQIFPNRTL